MGFAIFKRDDYSHAAADAVQAQLPVLLRIAAALERIASTLELRQQAPEQDRRDFNQPRL